jgi:hypothetical protein
MGLEMDGRSGDDAKLWAWSRMYRPSWVSRPFGAFDAVWNQTQSLDDQGAKR